MLFEESMHLSFIGSSVQEFLEEFDVLLKPLAITLYGNQCRVSSTVAVSMVVFSGSIATAFPLVCRTNLDVAFCQVNENPQVLVVRKDPFWYSSTRARIAASPCIGSIGG